MITLSGYQINETLYESANSLVYRGRRKTDGRPVVLKVLKDAYPSPERIAWFKREYEITRSLNPSTPAAGQAPPPGSEQAPSSSSGLALTGVAAAYDFHSEDNRWLMVLEDFGGESLVRLKLAGRLAVPGFLQLALAVAEILNQVHRRLIIHKDINPSNIVINPQTGQIKLIDFGLSTQLSRENSTFRSPNVLKGTLAYISPEQTGRMNRAIDYRSDFYSLGVTFYELLTGHLPFSPQDTLELVHSHIARQPVPPHELKPGLPVTLSELVLKLMAKNAEDRYQSAYGLKADLEECLRRWEANGTIEPFPLGRHDISDRLQISQKLYGREREIETLLTAFERVAGTNGSRRAGERGGGEAEENQYEIVNRKSKIVNRKSEMVLVSGYAGIGKTALVQEMYKPLTGWRGHFINGKFDQLQRDMPYAAFIHAFRLLIQHLLTGAEREIAAWREQLLAALGPNGRVITAVLPEVELITGPQPEAPNLSPAEAQNRFNLVWLNFIKAFTRPEHPLVIFLDDLQWADGASLKLLELLTTAADSHDLLLIGAYRDNEVNPAHPLMLALDKINQAGAAASHISLGPLALPHIGQLIADTFHCGAEEAGPLAELVLAKTGGNPFFINEFLKSLEAEDLLTFDFQQGRWQWDLAQIRQRNITDNVIELLTGKVQTLSAETQQALKLAACIGSQFDLPTLALVSEKSPHETAAHLWPALAEDLVLPLNDAYKLANLAEAEEKLAAEYKFAHNRVQQAVYSLIPAAEKEAMHWQIGQLLLRNTPAAEQAQKIFEIVHPLNQGRSLIKSQAERVELARLNLLAGQKAKNAAAFQPAFNYLKLGIELLAPSALTAVDGGDSWQQPATYDLSLSLYEEAAEAAYLNGEFEEMERLAETVLQKVRTLLDAVKVYEVRIQAYTAQNQLNEAIKTALQVLKMLEIELPEQPTQLDIFTSWEETKAAWIERGISSLLDLPEMTNPHYLKALDLINTASSALLNVNPMLYSFAVNQQVNLSIIHGNAPASAVAYATYGLLLCVFGDFEAGYQFGQLGLDLLKRFKATKLEAKIYYLTSCSGRPFKEPLRAILQTGWLTAYQNGLEIGDLEYAAYSALGYCQTLYLAGINLTEVEQEMAKYGQALTRFRQETATNSHRIFWQGVLNLMGRSEHLFRLTGEAYDEEKMSESELDPGSRGYLYTWKLKLCYHFQEFHQASEYLQEVEKSLERVMGTGLEPMLNLYSSLARLAIFPESNEAEQADLLQKVAANQEKMKLWAEHAPMNYRHKFLLVEAERAGVLGQDQEAREFYDQAIELAHENQYLNEEALAYELAGRFYLERSRTRLAGYYLRDAHYTYRRWGALAKAKDLEARYSQFLTSARSTRELPTPTTSTTDSGETASSLLDLTSVLKASQAISGEIELDKLLDTLMKLVVENAGAQRGCLLLEQDGAWVVEAEGVVAEGGVTAHPSTSVGQVANLSYPSPEGQVDNLPYTIVNYVARTREAVVLNDASHEDLFTQDPYITQTQPKSILCTPLINQGKLNGILYLENNLATGAFSQEQQEILSLLSGQAAISIENARLYTRQVELTRSATRFVPQEFLQLLGKDSIRLVNLGDQTQREVTIMVSDIRFFTALSETMTPQENFDFVNAYLRRVSPIIRQHHGFIAKYMGDGMMAVFPRQAEDALSAAIAQLGEVARYNVERQQQGQVPLRIGIGIHVGPVMLGTVGEAQRMQFDLMSDAVNVSARLEGLSKLYGVALIISAEVLRRLEDPTQYQLRFLGKTPLKGRQESLPIFEILDGDPAEVIALKMLTKTSFETALSLYYDWKFDEAKTMFHQALRVYPEDQAAQFYLKQMEQFMDYRSIIMGGTNIDELMNQ